MSPKSYTSVQDMLDDISPELGQHFRQHQKKPSVRLRHWWLLFSIRWKLRIRRWCGFKD